MLFRALLVVCALAPLPGPSSAQLTTTGVGAAFNSTPLTPCGASQLDLSDATGCNMTAFMVFLR